MIWQIQNYKKKFIKGLKKMVLISNGKNIWMLLNI